MEQVESSAQSGASARILVVDDDESNLAVLQLMLRRSGYAEVHTTSDSSDVIHLFDTLRPDLLLLDLNMPAPDGYALLGMLRERIDRDDLIPVVVLTADASSEAKERALGAGAHDFVTKPFDFAELSLRVRNSLALRARHCQLRAHVAAVSAD